MGHKLNVQVALEQRCQPSARLVCRLFLVIEDGSCLGDYPVEGLIELGIDVPAPIHHSFIPPHVLAATL